MESSTIVLVIALILSFFVAIETEFRWFIPTFFWILAVGAYPLHVLIGTAVIIALICLDRIATELAKLNETLSKNND